MKKTILTSAMLIACSMAVMAQTTQIDSNELKTISRNATIIQQQLHTLHLDAVLRDKLDSVFNQTSGILMDKYRLIKQKSAVTGADKALSNYNKEADKLIKGEADRKKTAGKKK